MTCVDGSCVDTQSEDVSGSEEDGDVSSVITQPDSGGNGGLVVRTKCPEGQIFQYGMCHTPVPESHYENGIKSGTGGCRQSTNTSPPHYIILGMFLFFLYSYKKRIT